MRQKCKKQMKSEDRLRNLQVALCLRMLPACSGSKLCKLKAREKSAEDDATETFEAGHRDADAPFARIPRSIEAVGV